jgi:ornithine cyclodeaminase
MDFISEAESSELITHEMAYAAIREALVAACDRGTASFPIVLGHGSKRENRFTVKAAATSDLAGLKVGSFWPANQARGLPRHNSMILLFDQEVGRIATAIEAGVVNAYRTAAADAIAADLLARPDARALAIFGAGHQARYECAALARVRRLEEVLVVARDPAKAAEMVIDLGAKGLPARPCGAEEACRAADLIVTATSATAPLFDAAWVRPGTHVASMGSDAVGKQELPPSLFAAATLFCDLPEQSRRIGDFQHAAPELSLVALGDVIAGRHPGRRARDEITVFDSSGLSIQDLYIGRRIVAAAKRAQGAVQH